MWWIRETCTVRTLIRGERSDHIFGNKKGFLFFVVHARFFSYGKEEIHLYHGFYVQYAHQEIVPDSIDQYGKNTNSMVASLPDFWQ